MTDAIILLFLPLYLHITVRDQNYLLLLVKKIDIVALLFNNIGAVFCDTTLLLPKTNKGREMFI